jgi:hypothetical protein
MRGNFFQGILSAEECSLVDSAAVLRLTNEKIIPLIRDSRLRIKESKRELLDVTNAVHAAGVEAIVKSFAENEDYAELRDELVIRAWKLRNEIISSAYAGYGPVEEGINYIMIPETLGTAFYDAVSDVQSAELYLKELTRAVSTIKSLEEVSLPESIPETLKRLNGEAP